MRIIVALLLLFLGLISTWGQADVVTVNNMRVWPAPDHTRLVFDLSEPLEHRLFTLKDPHRLVIDLENATLGESLPSLDFGKSLVTGMRSATRGDSGLRIVLDLKSEIRPRTFLLKPYEQYGHRLVVDLFEAGAAEQATGGTDEATAPPPAIIVPTPKPKSAALVVAIDAGHGGEDPGAIGPKRTREKDVVLAIARELQRLINARGGMRAVLIRDGDYYLSLRERIDKARKHDPDVFISIHADALPGKRRHVRGASVYALSERGASREAALIAERENAADLIGGVNLSDTDNVLNKVLVDMSQTGTISSSLELGTDILGELRRVGPLHLPSVEQAGFMVLRSPYIPSVLIETAFISNPDEEKKLRDKSYQRKIALGIYNGLQRAAPRLLARRGLPQTVSSETVPAGKL